MVLPVPKKRVWRKVFSHVHKPTYGSHILEQRRTRGQVHPAGSQPAINNPRARLEARRQEERRRLRSGSIFPLLKFLLMLLAKALREIRYYQSSVMAESLMIPAQSFKRVVQEICEKQHPGLRWEKDAVYALQTCTEHILVMFFEMTYDIHCI